MARRFRSPFSAALVAGALASAQTTSFYDLVRDELGCHVDDEAIEAVEEPGDSADAAAARLMLAGACDLPDMPHLDDRPPGAARWLPSTVSVEADVASHQRDDATSAARDLSWYVVFRIRWTQLAGGAR